MAATFEDDKKIQRKEITDAYGWFFLAKRVAEWSGEKYLSVMKLNVTDVFGMLMIMNAEKSYKELH